MFGLIFIPRVMLTLPLIDFLHNPSKRIPVEHVNAKIKAFKIVATKYRNRRKRFGLRFNLICALVNWDGGFAVV